MKPGIILKDKWVVKRPALRKIKTESREMEMIIDQFFDGRARIQASRDIALYGLYEAVLYMEKSLNDQQSDLLLDQLFNLLGI